MFHLSCVFVFSRPSPVLGSGNGPLATHFQAEQAKQGLGQVASWPLSTPFEFAHHRFAGRFRRQA